MKNGNLSTLIKKLDAIFSKYIRLRDADQNGICRCITCGTPKHWKELDNGHFIKRQNMSLRFNEINCNAQCRKCNWLEQGADDKYKEAIIKKYGQKQYDLLLYHKSQTKKWSRFELEYLIKEYQEKVKQYGY